MADARANSPRIAVPFRTRREEEAGAAMRAKIEPYYRAIREAGGEPVPVSLLMPAREIPALLRTLDGVVLPGSPADVDPKWFRAKPHPKRNPPDADRERVDFTLLDYALHHDKPVLGICYGVQSLNVFLGGTLFQDIPSELPQALEHRWLRREAGQPEPHHPATLDPASRLAALAPAHEITVNSSHHQSPLDPGSELRFVAHSPDGVVEAVEWATPEKWVFGVQWHPERLTADPLAQALFRNLISAARTPSTQVSP